MLSQTQLSSSTRPARIDAAAAVDISITRACPAAAPVAHGRRQAQRKALDPATAFGLIFLGSSLTHGTLTPAAFLLDRVVNKWLLCGRPRRGKSRA